MKRKLKSNLVVLTCSLVLASGVVSSDPIPPSDIFLSHPPSPNCETNSFDYTLGLKKDGLSRIVLGYFACIKPNKGFETIKDVEIYIDDTPVWSISMDSYPFGLQEVEDTINFLHGIILESIRDFKKGQHSTKVIIYPKDGGIESKIKTFTLQDDIKINYFGLSTPIATRFYPAFVGQNFYNLYRNEK
ncbi:hypothetical protein HYX19_03875 [Candidatus Woesearchaeota archaeon]|nr:hypothetical protein [Candidatus Woesearchaeota archaeon]